MVWIFHRNFRVIAALLSVTLCFLPRGTSLQCYVCGIETTCVSSPDQDEQFLKTCDENATHCVTAEASIYQPSRPVFHHLVLGCRDGEVSGCNYIQQGNPTYGRVCYTSCETDGCNGVALAQQTTTTTTTTTTSSSTTTSTTTTVWSSSSTSSRNPVPALCGGGRVCPEIYPYCCKSSDAELEYCCDFDQYQGLQHTVTTEEIVARTSPPIYWWTFVIPVAICTVVVILVILIRKRQKRRDRFPNTLNQVESAVAQRAAELSHNSRSAGSTARAAFTLRDRTSGNTAISSSISNIEPNQTSNLQNGMGMHLSLDIQTDPLTNFDIPPNFLDILSTFLSNEPTTLEPDEPPAYSSIDFENEAGRVIDPSPAFNEDDDSILPSYSSVVHGE